MELLLKYFQVKAEKEKIMEESCSLLRNPSRKVNTEYAAYFDTGSPFICTFQSERLTSKVEGSNISLQFTEASQRSASTFSRKCALGFGYLPLVTNFDPRYCLENSLYSRLFPTDEECRNASMLLINDEQLALQ